VYAYRLSNVTDAFRISHYPFPSTPLPSASPLSVIGSQIHFSHPILGLRPLLPTTNARATLVGFLVDKVAVRQDFLSVLRFSPFSIILSVLHPDILFYCRLCIDKLCN